MTDLAARLACPRCDKTPLRSKNDVLHCSACKVDFPALDGMPWLFAEPQAALGEWRGRLQFALQKISHEVDDLKKELGNAELLAQTRQRVERYERALVQHQKMLQELLQPLEVASLTGNYQTYLALRTRLPTDQGLNTYYAHPSRLVVG